MTTDQVNKVRDTTKVGTKVIMQMEDRETEERRYETGRIIKKSTHVFLAKAKSGKVKCFQWKELLMPNSNVRWLHEQVTI